MKLNSSNVMNLLVLFDLLPKEYLEAQQPPSVNEQEESVYYPPDPKEVDPFPYIPTIEPVDPIDEGDEVHITPGLDTPDEQRLPITPIIEPTLILDDDDLTTNITEEQTQIIAKILEPIPDNPNIILIRIPITTKPIIVSTDTARTLSSTYG